MIPLTADLLLLHLDMRAISRANYFGGGHSVLPSYVGGSQWQKEIRKKKRGAFLEILLITLLHTYYIFLGEGWEGRHDDDAEGADVLYQPNCIVTCYMHICSYCFATHNRQQMDARLAYVKLSLYVRT